MWSSQGGPGAGKTTLVNAILKILAAERVKVLLAAPTGRAAKRMTEATGMEARTIHRLLEFDPANGGFKRTQENPLDCNLLVLDEISMVDVPILASTLKAVRNGSAVILVGLGNLIIRINHKGEKVQIYCVCGRPSITAKLVLHLCELIRDFHFSRD